MNDTSATGRYYTLGHLVLFTGLTDRTLRSYLASGVLQGEKINGVWHFTPDQVNSLLTHPAVRPVITAKQNSLVYDFLLENRRREPECCIILDLPGVDTEATSAYFCNAINHGDYRNLRFTFDSVSGTARIILKGRTDEILQLVNSYHQSGIEG